MNHRQPGRYGPSSYSNSYRLKIQGPREAGVGEIVEALLERFPDRCITSPILPSREGGFHSFVNIIEGRR